MAISEAQATTLPAKSLLSISSSINVSTPTIVLSTVTPSAPVNTTYSLWQPFPFTTIPTAAIDSEAITAPNTIGIPGIPTYLSSSQAPHSSETVETPAPDTTYESILIPLALSYCRHRHRDSDSRSHFHCKYRSSPLRVAQHFIRIYHSYLLAEHLLAEHLHAEHLHHPAPILLPTHPRRNRPSQSQRERFHYLTRPCHLLIYTAQIIRSRDRWQCYRHPRVPPLSVMTLLLIAKPHV
ncbi:hypothetical protein NM688_g4636 [Phlebia brevispora]|uniref:Uncharacterized protein n=1 Tax=Phlebia brevispora TaxID=194682 RepID=A0ACC1T225_9APHY|nr:hypothetical protein NM688_g4636 [Phlebia brevispora]